MLLYTAKRFLLLIPVVIGISLVTFVISRVIPADPAQVAAGLEAGPAQVEALRELMGLNKPLYVQYIIYLRGLLRGDLGRSMRTRQPVLKDIQRYFPATVELAVLTMLLYVLIGVPLGILSAARQGGIMDLITRILSIFATAMPVFWLGLLFQLFFFRKLQVLPALGRLGLGVTPPQHITGMYIFDSLITGGWATLVSALRHAALPVMTLVLGRLAVAVRLTRASMLETLSKDYVRTAVSKGLTRRAVILRHAFRNALIPIVTVLSLQFGWLLGGAVLVEVIFSWPGMGKYGIQAITMLDFAPIMGIAIVSAVVFTLLNLFTDLLYCFMDPRIRY